MCSSGSIDPSYRSILSSFQRRGSSALSTLSTKGCCHPAKESVFSKLLKGDSSSSFLFTLDRLECVSTLVRSLLYFEGVGYSPYNFLIMSSFSCLRTRISSFFCQRARISSSFFHFISVISHCSDRNRVMESGFAIVSSRLC